MTGLVTPGEAVTAVRGQVARKWAAAVCAALGAGDPVTFSVPLRPGVSTGAAVERASYAAWLEWRMQWQSFTDHLPAGVELVAKPVTVRGVTSDVPATLTADLDGAAALVAVDLERAQSIASRLYAVGAALTPATLRAVHGLPDVDVEVLLRVVTWLHHNSDIGSWTLRQLPVPGMHTKWLEAHGALVRDLTGRDVRAEVRPRLTVTHLTYVDPHYLATGRRRHDAWTTGDAHDLAYRPRIVLVVENRDPRLWFPPVEGTIVVEGGGKAAAALLADVPWIRGADHVVYWGDIDADGYAILDRFRAALAEPAPDGAPGQRVDSILMDAADLHRYAEHGVDHDKAGRLLGPSRSTLPHLTDAEATAYATIATAGPTPFRRIEQEAVPLPHAAARLLDRREV